MKNSVMTPEVCKTLVHEKNWCICVGIAIGPQVLYILRWLIQLRNAHSVSNLLNGCLYILCQDREQSFGRGSSLATQSSWSHLA